MTVSVATRLYQSSGSSDIARLVIACIDGGREWLEWAIREPTAHFHFADESALVTAMQTGLHDTPLTLLRVGGLAVAPAKLMTLGLADLRVLAKVEAGEPVDPARVAAIHEAHDLMPQRRFVEARAVLVALGVADAPVFQAPGLSAWRAIAGLAREVGNGADPLSRDAGAFAIYHAVSPEAFCDYYRFYRDCIDALALADATVEARMAAASDALATLLPLTYAMLDGPMVDGLAVPMQIGAAIRSWRLMGRQVGFVRPSLAVGQIVAHGGYRGQTGRDAYTLVRDYMTNAQKTLDASRIAHGSLQQDGTTVRCPITDGGKAAVVEQGPTGQIALHMFDPGGAVRT